MYHATKCKTTRTSEKIWHFSTCESIKKIQENQERCFRIVLDNFKRHYNLLPQKSGNLTMEIKELRALATEIFRTVNNTNPNFKNKFTPKLNL